MITDGDIKKLKHTFATKKDLERFATKKDIENFATKKDLVEFVTKKDIKTLVTRDFLADTLQHFATRADFFELKEEIKSIKDDTSKILGGMDKILVRFDTLHTDYFALKASDDRQNKHIKQLADETNTKLRD